MSDSDARKILQALSHEERIESLSARFGLPHVPEYELDYFHGLYYPELSAALRALEADPTTGGSPAALSARGRLRRLLGDKGGAARDLQRALDLDASYAPAYAWLGEIALETEAGSESLTRSIELDPRFACARLYRGAGRLLRQERRGAREDLRRYVELRPDSCLGRLLLGLAEDGRSARIKSFDAAAQANPVCSAAYLLSAREARDPAEAAAYLRRAYTVNPVLGFITLHIHQTTEVESAAYVKKILRFCFTQPQKVGAYYQREATQTHYSHFPAEDYSFVDALVRRRPDLPWAHAFFGRAACYTPAGVAEGERRLSRAIELAPHAGWFYAWRANARAVAGRSEEALEDFATSVRLQPFYHRAFVWRGGLLRKLGRFEEALADLDRAVGMDPFYSLTYHERSLVRRALGDMVGAALDLDRAFLLDPRYRWVFKTGRSPTPAELEQGRTQLDSALARHASLPSLWVWRGQLELERGDFSRAFADLERAVRTDPHCALGLAWYGRARAEAGEPAAGAALLRRALEFEPRLWIAWGWLAQAQFAAGMKRDAYASLRRVLAEKPKTAWAHRQRARFKLDEGRPRQALPDLKRALLLDGKYPEAYLDLAQAHLLLGQTEAARAAADKCLEIAPNMGKAYLLRAEINARAGAAAQVIADYRRVRREFPYLFNAEELARVDRLLESAVAEAPGAHA